MKNKSLVIVCGDPESTFNEILIKTIKSKFFNTFKFPVIIVCSKKLFLKELSKLKKKINLETFDYQKKLNKKNIYFIDVPLNLKKLSLIKKNSYITKSFEIGLNLLKRINSVGLINGPISKTNFLRGRYNGMTEFFAAKTRSSNEVMLIFNKQLSVSPITTHIPVNNVSKKIKKKNCCREN